MLTEIEAAIVDRIMASALGPYLKTVDGYEKVMEAMRRGTVAGPLPGVFVKFGGGSFKKVAQRYAFKTAWTVFVAAQDLRGRDKTTKANTGAYAIIESLLALFTDHCLGLEIEPLTPMGVTENWDEDLEKQGVAIYGVDFQTAFVIEPVSDETVTDLLKVYLEYHLQDPVDNSVKDAEDQVQLQGGQ